MTTLLLRLIEHYQVLTLISFTVIMTKTMDTKF